MKIAVFSKPLEGVEGGDGYLVLPGERDEFALTVMDGLGHGQRACSATRALKQSMLANRRDLEPSYLLSKGHSDIRQTVGAACVVCKIDTESRTAVFSGIGNIQFLHVSLDRVHRKRSQPGILGYQQVQLRSSKFDWQDGDLIIAHTDGIQPIAGLPFAEEGSEMELACRLHERYAHHRDDALVLVCRLHSHRTLEVEEEVVRE